ncbi:hypothetical protein, partial [Marinobacterium zhoushanense]|uniref:hypothetical protein n=1 Tax=Marinobacterium zhoushanense TaxID=1679163 RepID=UPI001E4FDC12
LLKSVLSDLLTTESVVSSEAHILPPQRSVSSVYFRFFTATSSHQIQKIHNEFNILETASLDPGQPLKAFSSSEEAHSTDLPEGVNRVL